MERDDLKCENCQSKFPDYFLRDVESHVVLCRNCLANILIKECKKAVEIDNVYEGDLEEILKELESDETQHRVNGLSE